jgi:hypothetical protein
MQISILMKISPAGPDLLHVDNGRTVRQTDFIKLIFAFRNFSNVPIRVKVNVPRNRPEGPEGGRGTALLLGGQHHAPAALPSVKTRYQLYRSLGGPQGRSGRAPTRIRSSDRPARSQSLYRLVTTIDRNP